MPKLWTDTIEGHRREVRDAIMETTWSLVAEHGLLSVTMSRVAQATGIGRATLYKYFPDVESILAAWHERHVAGHLTGLAAIREQDGTARDRLEALAASYAHIARMRRRHGADELDALLHRGEHAARANQQLRRLFRELLAAAADEGAVRDDVPLTELASFCIHALETAGELRSEAAVRRLVALVLDATSPRR